MRHVLAAEAIPAVAFRMSEPTIEGPLIPPTGAAQALPAGFSGTALKTIGIAAITAPADQNRHAAPAAGIEPRDRRTMGIGTAGV